MDGDEAVDFSRSGCVSTVCFPEDAASLPFSHAALVSQHGSVQEENSGGSTRKHRGGKQRASR